MCSKGRKQFLTDKHDDHSVVSLDYEGGEKWWFAQLSITDGDDEIELYVSDSNTDVMLKEITILREFLDEFEAVIKAKGEVSE